jgi:hypothetical protein
MPGLVPGIDIFWGREEARGLARSTRIGREASEGAQPVRTPLASQSPTTRSRRGDTGAGPDSWPAKRPICGAGNQIRMALIQTTPLDTKRRFRMIIKVRNYCHKAARKRPERQDRPLRTEGRSDPARTVVTRPSRNLSGARAPGAAVTRSSLRPPILKRVISMQSPGEQTFDLEFTPLQRQVLRLLAVPEHAFMS